MTGRTHVDAVRAFVRNLNVVVKQVNMYGPAHKQVAPQLENTWKELRAALATDKVVLTAAGDHLLLAGKPLQAGSADRSFALLLVSAGIAGMCFLPDITQEQLEALVRLLANNSLQNYWRSSKRNSDQERLSDCSNFTSAANNKPTQD
jgi:hypothetical protein